MLYQKTTTINRNVIVSKKLRTSIVNSTTKDEILNNLMDNTIRYVHKKIRCPRGGDRQYTNHQREKMIIWRFNQLQNIFSFWL